MSGEAIKRREFMQACGAAVLGGSVLPSLVPAAVAPGSREFFKGLSSDFTFDTSRGESSHGTMTIIGIDEDGTVREIFPCDVNKLRNIKALHIKEKHHD